MEWIKEIKQVLEINNAVLGHFINLTEGSLKKAFQGLRGLGTEAMRNLSYLALAQERAQPKKASEPLPEELAPMGRYAEKLCRRLQQEEERLHLREAELLAQRQRWLDGRALIAYCLTHGNGLTEVQKRWLHTRYELLTGRLLDAAAYRHLMAVQADLAAVRARMAVWEHTIEEVNGLQGLVED